MNLNKCCNCGNYESNVIEFVVHKEEYNFEYECYCLECLDRVPSIKGNQNDEVLAECNYHIEGVK
ncbi:hypothetical protein J2X07_003742 [Fictibacillus barbaricus]|uniref:Uncharacterized protein n=1 Tax=Fictibacillus barbaricus TaxID=182136 RepID=A0ABU1U5J1_9BACL|nr:hypothetical protein [Fictibacillus barbaricus]